MTTLWIFGENFSAHWPEVVDEAPEELKKFYTYFKEENTWQHRVATTINANIKNYAAPFTSIEYLFKKFNDVRKNIKEGDTVILTIISPDIVSRSFVRDHPFVLNADTDFSKIKFHKDEKYISREDAFMLYLENFLYNLKDLTVQLNLNTMVIGTTLDVTYFLNQDTQRYYPITVAQGCLQEVSINEYDDETKQKSYYFQTDAVLKTNWLIQSNHKILAEKIIDNINNKKGINLTNGFVCGVITEQNRKNKEFLSSEY